MKCDSCGKEIVEESSFCNYCGTQVTKTTEEDSGYAAEQQEGELAPSVDSEKEINGSEQVPVESADEDNEPVRCVEPIFKRSQQELQAEKPKDPVWEVEPVFKRSEEELAMELKVKKPLKKRIKIFILIAVIALVGGGIKGCQLLSPYQEYHQAEALLENGEYEHAIEAFTELRDYKDASEMVRESNYQYALSFMKAKDYEKAIEKFEKIYMYKDSEQQYIEAIFQLGKKYYEDKNWSLAAETFSQILDKKPVKKLYVESIYYVGVKNYFDGHFTKASECLEKAKDYKDSKEYLSKLSILRKYEGTWEEERFGFEQVIINGWKLFTVSFPHNYDTETEEYDYNLEGTALDSAVGSHQLKNGKLIEVNKWRKTRTVLVKVSDSVDVPKEKPAPSIGMTKEEVLNSNWGKPTDINKTTTKYGVHEQWIYNGFKYIYLDDGVVTSIQE